MATSRVVSLRSLRSRRPAVSALGAVAAFATVAPAQQLEVQIPGTQTGGILGTSVAAGLDCDGDGIPDIAVGAPFDGTNQEGFVYLYSGATYSLIDSYSLGSTANNSLFGIAVALIGDVDGDGLSEVAVGAPGFFSGIPPTGFYGIYSPSRGLIRSGSGLDFGSAVAAAGDVDRDGAMDFIVGGAGSDLVRLVSGSTNATLHQFNGTQAGAEFGLSVAGNVDVDGDGTPDVIVGEPRFSFTFRGTTVSNCGHVTVYSGATFNPIWDALGPHAQDQLGVSVCGLGDVNGDGRSEVLAGAAASGGGSGIVIKFSGTGSQLVTLSGAGTDGYGQSICAVPDIDGDGIPEYSIGAPQPGTGGGYVDLRKGDDDTALFTFNPPDASYADYGWAVAAADFDADGRGDMVIGGPLRQVNGMNNAGDADVLRTVEAEALNYGAGFPGTFGIPNFTAVNIPGIAETFTANLDNSLGASTIGLLVFGFARENVPTSAGGTMLVAPFEIVQLALPAGGLQLSGNIPPDPALIGVLVDLQVLELDAGAAHHLSFTPGLELKIGVDYP